MSEPTEVWLPIPGWEGKYLVSSLGRVRSLTRYATTGCILKPHVNTGSKNKEGYPKVTLCDRGRKYRRGIHQLVAAAFIGPCPPGHQVRHLDGNRRNPVADNLAYGTISDNQQDAVRHGTHYPTCKTHCKRGHEFTPENTYLHTTGIRTRRHCRTCRQLQRGRTEVTRETI